MAYSVFKAEDILRAIQEDPEGVWMIEKKKKEPTKKYKCSFVDIFFNVGTDHKKKHGWFSIRDVELSAGVADKNDASDPRNAFDGTRLQLQTSLSKSGAFGAFLAASNPEWARLFELRKVDGTIVVGSRKWHPLLQTHVSEESDNVAARGQPLEDPIIRLKIDWKPFPEGLKGFLAGQPKTQFYDYRKQYVDKDGKTQYELAKVEVNGESVLVNDDNLHLFVTKGSIIREGTVMIQSVVSSAQWVSIPITALKMVVEPGPDDGFVEATPTFGNKQAVTTVTTTSNVEPQQEVTVANASEIDEALAGLGL